MKASNPKLGRTVLCAFLLLTACWCRAEENLTAISAALNSTTISGSVDTSAQWNFEPTIQVVPEPSTVALLAIGGVAAAFIVRRQKQRR